MTPEGHEAAGRPLGILAGSGQLPLAIAAAAQARGRPVHIVGIDGFADADIGRYPHERVNLGQVGRMIGSLQRAGCTDMIIAGALRRPNLWALKIDSGFFRSIGTVLKLTRGGDDSVLRRVVRFFEAQGFKVCGVPDVAPDLLAPEGVLGRVRPTPEQSEAITRGTALVRALGAFDVGQGTVVTPSGVVVVEGVRGTDSMLEDAAEHVRSSGRMRDAVLVKLPKPDQEMRVDLPVIGPATIEAAARAGLAGVAIGAGQSLVLDRDETIRLADAAGLFVMGLAAPGIADEGVSKATDKLGGGYALAGRLAPTPADRADIALGRRLMQVLVRHNAGTAAVIAGEHVLAVNGALPVQSVLRGIGSGSHWGRRVFRKRIGVLVLQRPDLIIDMTRTAEDDNPVDFAWIAEAGLAGIVCASGAIPADLKIPVAAQANAMKLFLTVSSEAG
jgi:UDP-2,3-diacylglucosamine hydrolase